MNDNRNMILAIALSVLVLLGWGLISETWFPTASPPTTKIEQGRSVPLPQPNAGPAADSPRANRDRAVVLAETPRVRIETPRLAGSINLRGARIDDLVLSTHTETIAANSPPVRLFAPAGTKGAYFAGPVWSSQGVAVPGAATVWTASGTKLTPTTPVTLSWSNPTGQTFRIEYSVDANYMITAKQTVANTGTAPVVIRSGAMIDRSGTPTDLSPISDPFAYIFMTEPS